MDYLETLFHSFFMAKFFPNGNIMEVKEGNDSFAWKSILKGKDVIKKGAQWRVGDGSSIQIFKDGWLLTPHHSRILSPITFFDPNAPISVLIDKERNYWLADANDNNFLPFEAKTIKSIPLSLFVSKDKLF